MCCLLQVHKIRKTKLTPGNKNNKDIWNKRKQKNCGYSPEKQYQTKMHY